MSEFRNNDSLLSLNTDPIPEPNEKAATARWIVRNNNWGTIGTTSTLDGFAGRAFANPNSYADGVLGGSTGEVFLYVTDMDQSMVDVAENNQAAFSISEAQIGLCAYRWRGCQSWVIVKIKASSGTNWQSFFGSQLDPEDPRCARLVLMGTIAPVDKDDARYEGALAKMFYMHPAMADWPDDHMFYLAEFAIESVWLIDYFGGAYTVPLPDYYAGHEIRQ